MLCRLPKGTHLKSRGGSRNLKGGGGGFFLLLWLAGHSQPHPLSIVFLAKGGGSSEL